MFDSKPRFSRLEVLASQEFDGIREAVIRCKCVDQFHLERAQVGTTKPGGQRHANGFLSPPQPFGRLPS